MVLMNYFFSEPSLSELAVEAGILTSRLATSWLSTPTTRLEIVWKLKLSSQSSPLNPTSHLTISACFRGQLDGLTEVAANTVTTNTSFIVTGRSVNANILIDGIQLSSLLASNEP